MGFLLYKNSHDIINHINFFIHRYINVSGIHESDISFKMALHQIFEQN